MAIKPWKRAKGQAEFRRYHSTVEHLVPLRIISKECHNNKTNISCYFFNLKKEEVDTICMTNLWNRLGEIKVPFELRVGMTRLYENVSAKFRTIEGSLEEINYDIKVKQGHPLLLTLFGTQIDNLKECLEEVGCVGWISLL